MIGCGESGAGEEKERVSMGGKEGGDEIRSEIGKVTGKAEDTPTTNSLRKGYG